MRKPQTKRSSNLLRLFVFINYISSRRNGLVSLMKLKWRSYNIPFALHLYMTIFPLCKLYIHYFSDCRSSLILSCANPTQQPGMILRWDEYTTYIRGKCNSHFPSLENNILSQCDSSHWTDLNSVNLSLYCFLCQSNVDTEQSVCWK